MIRSVYERSNRKKGRGYFDVLHNLFRLTKKIEKGADCDEAVWCNIVIVNINYWISLPKSKYKRRI